MSTSLVVRDATLSDLDWIVDWNCRLAEESEHKRLNRETLKAGVRRGLTSPELCRYFVAEVEGKRAGTTMVTYEMTDWRDGVIWWLQSVYVEPDCRKRGVFRALYRHIKKLAQDNPEVRGLRLYVAHGNTRAQQTYASLGMQPGGYEVFETDWSGATDTL